MVGSPVGSPQWGVGALEAVGVGKGCELNLFEESVHLCSSLQGARHLPGTYPTPGDIIHTHPHIPPSSFYYGK